jgi:N-formylglutamate amidohydrolase
VLKNQLSTAFKAHGYDVAIDSPFSGTIVPLKHYHKDQRVLSVMIEVNRSLYASPSGFKRVQSDLTHAILQAATIRQMYEEGITATHSPKAEARFISRQPKGVSEDD